MKFSELLEQGGLVAEGVTARKVVWNGAEFDVLVKNEMSAADFEFIFATGTRKTGVPDSDEAHMARRVHRLTRLGSDHAVVPYEQAVKMKLPLLLAICAVINSVHAEMLEADNAPKS